MNIYKDFLPNSKFKEIESYLMSDQIPWFYSPGVVHVPGEYSQFTFTFVREGKINCTEEQIKILKPVVDKLKVKILYRIKANLLTKTEKIVEHGYHTDYEKNTHQCNNGSTAILYVNTCNGYTKFKNNKKVMSKKNKLVKFNTSVAHTGSSCTDEERRVVINFNYL
jgi:hypothetical protein